MKLRRIRVKSLPPSCADEFAEFMLFHGVVAATVSHHADGIDVTFRYAGEAQFDG